MSLYVKDGLNTVMNRSVQLKFQTVVHVHVDMCNLKYVNHTCRLHKNLLVGGNIKPGESRRLMNLEYVVCN